MGMGTEGEVWMVGCAWWVVGLETVRLGGEVVFSCVAFVGLREFSVECSEVLGDGTW